MLTYSELIKIDDFEERYLYLAKNGIVGEQTFGHERWMNQNFYRSAEWRKVRDKVILRDDGFDLAHRDYPIRGNIIIHHINPLTPEMIEAGSSLLFDMDNLISCSLYTHNLIHYGDANGLPKPPVERTPNDTSPWRL